MKTYRILAKPDIRLTAADWPALSEELLSQAIADISVRKLSEDRLGQATVDVQLNRSDHEEALNELAKVIEQSGYALVNTLVTEWISAETQRAVIAAAMFLFGTEASKNPFVGLAAGAGATWIANETGWVIDRVIAQHTAGRDIVGNWTLTKIPRASSVGREPEAGFSVA